MADSVAQKIRYEPLRSLAYTSISSGSFTAVGTAFANPVRILQISNFTDGALLISFDGTTNMDIVASNEVKIVDYGANASLTAGVLEQSAYNQMYVKSTASLTSGTVYVTVIYASKN